ncbi:MAG: hypothetical protein NC453_23950 [Muribaculum sp.]|nr:hypothetical protein [Muribaculum sp.]
MIYQISLNFNFALGDITKILTGTDPLELNSENVAVLDNFQYDWDTDESSLMPNLTIIFSELLCCDLKAHDYLKAVMTQIVFNKILIGKDEFFSISNIPCLKERLNLKSSKIKYFSTGDIMEIERPMFNSGKYPPLFKVEEMPGVFFCSELFKDTIENNHLSGLLFTERKIKNKSWISKFL